MIRIPSANRYRVPTLTLLLGGTMAFGCSAQEMADLHDTASTQQGVSALGNLDVAAGTTRIVNTYAALAADVTQGATSVSVTPEDLAALNVAAGDLVMIYQAQGAQIGATDDSSYGAVSSLGGAGMYEVFRVSGSAPGGTIALSPGCTLRNAYATTGKAQLVRVPRYRQVTVRAGQDAIPHGVLTASPWNGRTGGVLALRADVVSVDGEIDASGTGFRGGRPNAGTGDLVIDQVEYRSATAPVGAEKGEGIAGSLADYDGLAGRYGRGAPANGGGGGNNTNAGGGGGANAGSSATYTGDGVMGNTQAFAAAWMLDPAYIAKGTFSTSSGGGRGSYTFTNVAQDPTMVGPGDASWGGSLHRERGGRGGHPLAPDATSRVFFGGGGGGGEANNGQGSAGGAGGGIVMLLSPVITATGGGCINSSGAPGGTAGIDGAGGGGGGGSVVLSARKINGVSVTAFGGKGGDNSHTGVELHGTGGGGGGGFVAAPTTANLQPQVGGAPAGVSASPTTVLFPVDGATDGSPGTHQPFDGALPVCSPADVSVAYSATPATVRDNVPIFATVQVSNAGPEDAQNLKLTLPIPANTTVASEPAGGGWTCTRAADVYTCTLASLTVAAATSQINFVLAARPNAAAKLDFTAQVSADNAEPNPNNNSASASVAVDRTEIRGDGFTCQAAHPGAGAGKAGVSAFALLMGLGAALRLRRRRGGVPQ